MEQEKINHESAKEFYERKPNHEFSAKLSKDGNYWIFKSSETWIVPVNYIDKIRDSKNSGKNEDTDRKPSKKSEAKGG
jgi:hypothetical protein